MKLINSSVNTINPVSYTLDNVYKMIELAGRTCYKSEDKITETSAKEFVNRMIKSGHGAMLEHGTVYLKVPTSIVSHGFITGNNWRCLMDNPYTKATHDDSYTYFTTNYRVIVENDLEGVLEYICEPTEHHEKRITIRFICDRGVSHEFVRHRVFSFAQESTRYCNYSKDKFGNELTFIIPCWLNIPEGKYTNIAKQSNEDGEYKQIMLHENNINAYPLTTTSEGRFLWNCYWDEHDYFDLLNYDWKPQEARAILSNSLKTELIMTGFVSDWKHFFELRCAPSAHPDARKLALELLHKIHTDYNFEELYEKYKDETKVNQSV